MAKRILSVIISILLLLLCGCSAEDSKSPSAKKDGGGWKPNGKKVESTVFGRSIEYDSWSPSENIALPFKTSEILDIIQIEKTLYILTSGGIYALEAETGKSSKLIDAPANSFYIYAGNIYTYNSQSYELSVYDMSGSLIERAKIAPEEADRITGLYVTDNCFVLGGEIQGKIEPSAKLYCYNKETKELSAASKSLSYNTLVCGYSGNELLVISEDSMENTKLQSMNAETAKFKELKTLGYGLLSGNAVAPCYNPQTDTLILFYADHPAYNMDGVRITHETAVIEEHSLAEKDSLVLKKFPLSVSVKDRLFVSVYENIILNISTVENKFGCFDFMNPPKSITVGGSTSRIPKELIKSFENEYGVLVRTASLDYDRLSLKLMAGDTDFDLFITEDKDSTNIILSGAYSDLSKYESLSEKISKNKLAAFVSSHNGSYFGVPIDIVNYYAKENWAANFGDPGSYSHTVSEVLYCAQNIDISEYEYSDSDGDKLYKLLKFICENPQGSEDKMPFGKEIALYSPFYLMMNPSAGNAGMAIKFLEYALDAFNGDISGAVSESHIYPLDEPDDNCYVSWKCMSISYRLPISAAREKALQSDGDAKALKKLAREAAAEVNIRLKE